MQVFRAAHLPERAPGELAALLGEVTPEIEVAEEVRALVGEAPVHLVGLVALLGRALADVLHGEGGHHHQEVAQRSVAVPLDHHARQARVEGEGGHVAADAGQARARVVVHPDRPELGEQGGAVAHGLAVGRFHEGELVDRAEVEVGHREDHRGEIGAQDLGIGELRP